MEDIQKRKEYLLCLTVLRYSYVRELPDNKSGWGFNFQGASNASYTRLLEILKPQIPNGAEYSRVDLISEVLGWSDLDGFETFPLGLAVKEMIEEGERKAKDKTDDDLLLYTNGKGSSVQEVIIKEMDVIPSKYFCMAVMLRDLARLMYRNGIMFIQRKTNLLLKIMEEEDQIIKEQTNLINLGWDVVSKNIKSKDEIESRLEPMRVIEKDVNMHLREFGEMQIDGSNKCSLDKQRQYFMVRSLANWEDVNLVDTFNSKNAQTWINSNSSKAYLTGTKKPVALEGFSEKYKKNQTEVTKAVAQAYQYCNEMVGNAGTPIVQSNERVSDEDGLNRSSRNDEEKAEQKNAKIRGFKRR